MEKLIRSLIVQFGEQYSYLPDFLQSAYSQSQNGQKQPTMEVLKSLLLAMLKHYDLVYILIDALDECKDRDELLGWIGDLKDLKLDNLHLLATSRKERDIDEVLQPLATYQLSVQNVTVDADIRLYIQDKISNDPRLKKWPLSVKREIEDALTEGAKGMYICSLIGID